MEYLKIFMGTLWGIAIVCLLIYFYYLYIIVGGKARFNDRTYRRFLKKRVKGWSLYGKNGELIYWEPFGATDIQHISQDLSELLPIYTIMVYKNRVGRFRYARRLKDSGYKLVIDYYDKNLDN